MKKLTQSQQNGLLRAGLRRWVRAVARKSKVYLKSERVRIVPPNELSFARNFRGTMAFIDRLREATLKVTKRRKIVYVDLVPVISLSVPVAIVLAAEFHRWSLIKGARLQPRNSSRWTPSVRNLLSDLGVFKLLGSKSVDVGDGHEHDNFTLTQLESGEKTDGQKIDDLQSHFAQSLAGFTRKPTLFEGLMEAAENAISHAYPPDFEPDYPYAGHRWWGASCLDLREKRLRFFIFDQGAGIPFTLPKGPLWERILTFVAERSAGVLSDDAHMLEAAFASGRTRTGLTNRGLGLQRMADVVRGSGSGYLRIISGKAEVVHHHDNRIVTTGLPSHIGGTLIEWSLPADVFVDSSEETVDAKN